MVQPKFNDASKPTTLDVSMKEKDRNLLESESSEKLIASKENGVWITTYKYTHLVFTVCLILRLFTLILTEDIGPAFVGISKHFNFTPAGLNLEPAVNYLLWFSVMVLQLDAMWHAHVTYNLLAGTNDKLIKLGRAEMSFKYAVPQLVLGILVTLQLREIYLRRQFQSVVTWHICTSFVVLGFRKILKKENKGRTPIGIDEDFEFKFIHLQMVFLGLVLLLMLQLDLDLNLLHNQFWLILTICASLFLPAHICIMRLKKAKQSPSLNIGSNEIPTIIVTSVP